MRTVADNHRTLRKGSGSSTVPRLHALLSSAGPWVESPCAFDERKTLTIYVLMKPFLSSFYMLWLLIFMDRRCQWLCFGFHKICPCMFVISRERELGVCSNHESMACSYECIRQQSILGRLQRWVLQPIRSSDRVWCPSPPRHTTRWCPHLSSLGCRSRPFPSVALLWVRKLDPGVEAARPNFFPPQHVWLSFDQVWKKSLITWSS